MYEILHPLFQRLHTITRVAPYSSLLINLAALINLGFLLDLGFLRDTSLALTVETKSLVSCVVALARVSE